MKYICAYHINDRSDKIGIFSIEAKDEDDAETVVRLYLYKIYDPKNILYLIEELSDIPSFKLITKVIEEKEVAEIDNILIK